jgi:hypothetical protein
MLACTVHTHERTSTAPQRKYPAECWLRGARQSRRLDPVQNPETPMMIFLIKSTFLLQPPTTFSYNAGPNHEILAAA